MKPALPTELLQPAGPGGLYLRLSDQIDATVNERVQAVAAALVSEPFPGLKDVVPSYVSVYVEFDPAQASRAKVGERLISLLDTAGVDGGREVEVPVRYDGIDLKEAACTLGIEEDELVRRHTAPIYRVHAVGFTPGFPFMGEVDPSIRLPRHPEPRPTVDAHSVAIADSQTGIYPLPSPGGWRLLGTALTPVYDPHRERPFLLEPGNRVRFIQAEGEAPAALRPLNLLPEEPVHPALFVHEPGLFDLLLDGGRTMGGRFGLARSGPLDRRSARLANRLLGNSPEATLLELNLRGPTLELLRDTVLAFAGYGMTPVLSGEHVPPFRSFFAPKGADLHFRALPVGARGYLAIAGGLASDTFMGSTSVDARGLIGRPLKAGDLLGVAALRWPRAGFTFTPHHRRTLAVRLRILPGPQATPEAVRALVAQEFQVRSADRMGVRFAGGQVPAGGGVISEANPLGSLQVTTDGSPLLLLNDRGTIGGYAKPALIHPSDLPKAGQLRIGDSVRFDATDHLRRQDE